MSTDGLLRELLVEIRALRSKQESTPPRRDAYTFAEAGILLGGVNVKTIRAMVARGQLFTCELGLREGIPRTEIERVTTPKRVVAKTATRRDRRPKEKTRSEAAKDHAAKIRELAKLKD